MIFANYNTQSCIKMCRSFIVEPETFFCRSLKNGRMSFLDQCNVETVSRLGFQGLSCSKVAGFEGGSFQKLFKGYIFCFLGHLVGGQLNEQFAHETNLKKKRSVGGWKMGRENNLLLYFEMSNNVHHGSIMSETIIIKSQCYQIIL